MRLKGSVRQINLLSLFFLLNLNFVISTRIAKLAPVLTRQNSIRVEGIFFGEELIKLNRIIYFLNFISYRCWHVYNANLSIFDYLQQDINLVARCLKHVCIKLQNMHDVTPPLYTWKIYINRDKNSKLTTLSWYLQIFVVNRHKYCWHIFCHNKKYFCIEKIYCALKENILSREANNLVFNWVLWNSNIIIRSEYDLDFGYV